MKKLPVGRGHFALVDDDQFEELSKYRWKLMGNPKRYYATRTVYMHKQIMGVDCVVDHRNHDTLDNRRENLRPSCKSSNNWNIGKIPQKQGKKPTSRFKGVCKPTGTRKWLAKIRHHGRVYKLGAFENEEDAARAYNAKAKELFGDFAWLNPV